MSGFSFIIVVRSVRWAFLYRHLFRWRALRLWKERLPTRSEATAVSSVPRRAEEGYPRRPLSRPRCCWYRDGRPLEPAGTGGQRRAARRRPGCKRVCSPGFRAAPSGDDPSCALWVPPLEKTNLEINLLNGAKDRVKWKEKREDDLKNTYQDKGSSIRCLTVIYENIIRLRPAGCIPLNLSPTTNLFTE